jgi:hypothetical protein
MPGFVRLELEPEVYFEPLQTGLSWLGVLVFPEVRANIGVAPSKVLPLQHLVKSKLHVADPGYLDQVHVLIFGHLILNLGSELIVIAELMQQFAPALFVSPSRIFHLRVVVPGILPHKGPKVFS